MTVKVRNLTNPGFLITSIILLVMLFIRVTRGLDLTDEMQYYGEIKGLLESGKLFSNDLFIQQSVYILLYPVFYLYHLVYGFEGFVFFGRLIMAFLSLSVFLYAYKKLLEMEFSAYVASLTALSLSFAISYHGIFAPSYNTISQVLWIVFALGFFEWKRNREISLGALPIIMFFAHPFSALMMSFLILARLVIERDFRRIVKFLLVFICSALIALPAILYFAAPGEYLSSIAFSSGHGVGTVLLSNKYQLYTLIGVYVLFVVSLLFWKRLDRLNVSMFAVIFIAIAIVLWLMGLAGGAYTSRVLMVLAFLSALAYGWSLLNVPEGDTGLRQRIHWLVVMLLSYATTLGITSGNGIAQLTGAFMVGLPLLLGVAVTYAPSKRGPDSHAPLKIMSVLLVCTLFVMHWSRYPYREDTWWHTNQPIQSVPEFRFIRTTQEREEFIQRMQYYLGPVTQGKRTLIISELPVLYLALKRALRHVCSICTR